MTKTAEQALIAILIEKLGGEVKVTREELFRADELEVTEWDDPVTMTYKLTAERPPEILQGEIVTAEPQSIEPPRMVSRGHTCEDWQIVRELGTVPYCRACGRAA